MASKNVSMHRNDGVCRAAQGGTAQVSTGQDGRKAGISAAIIVQQHMTMAQQAQPNATMLLPHSPASAVLKRNW